MSQLSTPCRRDNVRTVTVGPLTPAALWLIYVSTEPWSDSRASAFSSSDERRPCSIHDTENEASFGFAHRWSAGNGAAAFCRGGF